MIAAGQDIFKTRASLSGFADGGQRKNPPEGTDKQGRFRNTLFVFSLVTQQEIAAQELFFDPCDRPGETGIVRFQEMQFTQQQQAGIDGISVPCGG